MEKHKDPRMPLAPSGWRAYLAHQMTEKVLGEVVNLLPGGMHDAARGEYNRYRQAILGYVRSI